MFFLLSKTIAFLLLPSNFLILLGLIGILLMLARRKRAGQALQIWMSITEIEVHE